MNIDVLRLLFDFGLVVLIWIVQLIIYPSFLFYQKKDLLRWHDQYTSKIAMIVIPLMIGQFMTSSIQVAQQQTVYSIASSILIILVWILTFSQFVPMHKKITAGDITEIHLRQLVTCNWSRTILWTVVFIFSCLINFK